MEKNIMKCTLVADINKCQYFNKETQECNNDGKCSFQSKDEEKNVTGYVRQERWFEKYYRK